MKIFERAISSSLTNWIKLFIVLTLCILFVKPADGQYPAQDSLYPLDQLLVWEKKYQAQRNEQGLAYTYDALRFHYSLKKGKNTHVLNYLLKSMRCFLNAGDSLNYYRTQIFLGNFYEGYARVNHNYVPLYVRALRYFEQTDRVSELLQCKRGLLHREIELGDSPQILERFREMIATCKRFNLSADLSIIFNELANYYLQNKKLGQAAIYVDSSMVLSQSIGLNWVTALNHFYKGLTVQYGTKPQMALKEYYASEQLALNEQNYVLLKSIYRHISECHAELGEVKKAYKYELMAAQYATLLYESTDAELIRYQEFDSRIKQLELERAILDEQQKTHWQMIYLLVSGFLIAASVALVLFLLRSRQRLISREKEVTALRTIKELELRSMRALLDGQEMERDRVVRDLHDGIGASLAALKLHIESEKNSISAALQSNLSLELDEICQELRLVLANLSPVSLKNEDLVSILRHHIMKVQTSSATPIIHFEVVGTPLSLSQDIIVNVFRITQELLHNVFKYANASYVTVQLCYQEMALLLSVEDDGSGFDVANVQEGNGIYTVKARVTYLNGEVEWHSTPMKGTAILITIPK
jgi:two-component system, NarL family, sensor kinase